MRALLAIAAAAVVVSCNDPKSSTGGAISDAANAASSAAATSPTSRADAATTTSSAAVDAGPPNPLAVPAAAVMAVVNPSNAPAYDGPTGSLEGTVTYVGDPPRVTPTRADPKKCSNAESVYGSEFRLAPDGKSLADAIVAVTGFQVFVPAKTEGVQVVGENCGISPRTITMTFGQRLEIRNKGGDFFAPFIERVTNGAVMVAAPRATDAVMIYPRRPGRFTLSDQLGKKYMQNDIYVLLQPLHAVTDTNGHYRIDGIPVGKLTVNATHPAFSGAADMPVEILPSVVGHADLVITRKTSDAGAAPTRPPPGAPR